MQAPSGSPSMHFLAHPLPCSCPSSSHLSAVSLPISFFHLLPFSFFLFVPTPSPPPHLVSLSSSACFSCLSTVKIGVPHIGSSECPTTMRRCAPLRFPSSSGGFSAAPWEFVTLFFSCWEIVTRWLGFCHKRIGNLSHLLFLLGNLSRFGCFRQGNCHAHIGVLSRSCWEFVTNLTR